jgi:hypothetical protein
MVKPNTTPILIGGKQAEPVISRRNDSQSLDRERSIPNQRRIIGEQAEEANSPALNGRRLIESGGGTQEAGPNEGARELSISPASQPIWKAENVLQTIADRFTAARTLQKSEAWRQLQMDLMQASPFLVPVIIPYKDLISIVSDIEKEIKGGIGHQGKSNEEIMADFLSGEGTLVVTKTADEASNLDGLSSQLSLDTSGTIDPDGGDTSSSQDIPLSKNGSTDTSSPPSD